MSIILLMQDLDEELTDALDGEVMEALDGEVMEHTGAEHLEEADSYYDPPTFLGDEYNELLDEAGRKPRPVETPFTRPHASNHVCIINLRWTGI